MLLTATTLKIKVGETGFEPRKQCFRNLYHQTLKYENSDYMSEVVSMSNKITKVGETGFEPATLRSQSECATGLRYSPCVNTLR